MYSRFLQVTGVRIAQSRSYISRTIPTATMKALGTTSRINAHGSQFKLENLFLFILHLKVLLTLILSVINCHNFCTSL